VWTSAPTEIAAFASTMVHKLSMVQTSM
jgi:hypothetical protein